MLIITVEADEVRSVEVDSDALKIETPAAVISFWGRAGALEGLIDVLIAARESVEGVAQRPLRDEGVLVNECECGHPPECHNDAGCMVVVTPKTKEHGYGQYCKCHLHGPNEAFDWEEVRRVSDCEIESWVLSHREEAGTDGYEVAEEGGYDEPGV
jgi:hypothetical protein